jgi:hypothetical protein
MSIDMDKIKTQDDMDQKAPIDQVEERVAAELKRLEGTVKRDVAEGLQNSKLAQEGERLQEEGERDLQKATHRTVL